MHATHPAANLNHRASPSPLQDPLHAYIELYSVPDAEKGDATHAVVLAAHADGSELSKPVGISTTGLKTSATIPVRGRLQQQLGRDALDAFASSVPAKHRYSLDVGLAVSNVPGSFHRSKVVVLTPRLVLVNKSGFELEFAQAARCCLVADPPAAVFRLPSSPPHLLPGVADAAVRAFNAGWRAEGPAAAAAAGAGDSPHYWSPVNVSAVWIHPTVLIYRAPRSPPASQWSDEAAPHSLLVRLRAAPDIPPLQADSAVSPGRNPFSALSGRRHSQSLRLDAAGASDDDAATWEWSRPIPADAGDVTLKLRRRLYGPHADTAPVCPDPSLDEGAAGGEPIDAEQLLHRRGGVSPTQVC